MDNLIQIIDKTGLFKKVWNFHSLKTGAFSSLYKFDTEAGVFVLKIPIDKKSSPLLKIGDALSKIAVTNGFPTIVPILTEVPNDVDGTPFQIIPFVGDNREEFNTLPVLHEIYFDGFGTFKCVSDRLSGEHNTWNSYLFSGVEECIEFCLSAGSFNKAEGQAISQHIKSFNKSCSSSLLHNDLSSDNIIGNYVIDWDRSICGDKIYDIASWCAFHMPDKFNEIIVRYYQGRPKPLDFSYRFWVYYLHTVLFRTVDRHKLNKLDNPKYPPASRRIQLALSKLKDL